jgi:hypothetical protein
MKWKRIAAIGAVAMLAGCGRVADLEPRPGHALPVKPMMARTTPTVEQLLTVPTYARPDRVDELVRRSQPRAADPFNLPPPTGGSAPSEPAGTAPGPVDTNQTSVTPGD